MFFSKKKKPECARCKRTNIVNFEVNNTMVLSNYDSARNSLRRDDSSFNKTTVGVCQSCGAYNYFEHWTLGIEVLRKFPSYGSKESFEESWKYTLKELAELNKTDVPVITLSYKVVD